MEEMAPWIRGFKGKIVPHAARDGGGAVTKFTTIGDVDAVPKQKNSVRVTELPVRKWTETYKEWLAEQLQLGVVKDFRENHSEVDVDFTVHLASNGLETLLKTGGGRGAKGKKGAAKKKGGRPTKDEKKATIISALRLESTINLTNMHLFSPEGKIKRYESALDVIEEWVPLRLEMYARRRELQLERLEARAMHRATKARFIRDVVAGASSVPPPPPPLSLLAPRISDAQHTPVLKQNKTTSERALTFARTSTHPFLHSRRYQARSILLIRKRSSPAHVASSPNSSLNASCRARSRRATPLRRRQKKTTASATSSPCRSPA